MPTIPDTPSGIHTLGAFAGFILRFDELIGASARMALFFIHSRRWRENHELMFSLEKHFDDGPLIPAMVADAYRYFARLAREYGKPVEIRLFGRYPTYSFYRFDDRAVIALYSNAVAKKELPAFEVSRDSFLGRFLDADIDDLRAECRQRAPEELETVIQNAGAAELL